MKPAFSSRRKTVSRLPGAMTRLLSDVALRGGLGNNGNAWARNFMLENVAQSQEACYLSCAEKRRR